ncbi:DUF6397 family protein [Streptomyces sp. NBC_00370]|uniref:DUF6397 family protein n=1 Tax=Streptomyces sp. NBC_00370 TaxID=2975728 RepID=UPI002E25F988
MTVVSASAQDVGVVRAARELELKRGEFQLAVQLGHIRTTAGTGSGRRRVAGQEIARLRAVEGFPDTLRERVRTVGTAEGAALIGISPGRFTRLARAGFLIPVRFYLNRYRAVVWLYLAAELAEFGAAESTLLTGPLPPPLRALLDSGEDRRPRNWRGRRVGLLLNERDDPWERAACAGSVLDDAQLAEVVPDSFERAYLDRLRPVLAPGGPATEAGQAALRELLVADRPDEIEWHRTSLAGLLEEARALRPAPGSKPGPDPSSGPAPVVRRGQRAGLLSRLGIRKGGRPAGASV